MPVVIAYTYYYAVDSTCETLTIESDFLKEADYTKRAKVTQC